MHVIDADTHVIESEATWEYFDSAAEHLRGFRPQLVISADPRTGQNRNRWIINGTLVPKPEGRGAQFVAGPPIESGGLDVSGVNWDWRSLEDPNGRLVDAKERGVDTQVVYPTLFLGWLTDDVEIEVALCRSYNRFLADRWTASGGLLRWVIVPPLRSIPESLEELRYGREHGAVGVFFRGLEGDRSLGDPYFDPIYAEANRLGMPICVHTGSGCPALTEMADSRYMRNFGQVRVLPLIAFHDIIFSRVPERHPGLKFGFIEASASWIPFLLHFLKRAAIRSGPRRSGRDASWIGPEMFEECCLYVACEADEDIPALARDAGWDHLLIGSDYGHGDQSSELDLVNKLNVRDDLSPEQMEKILSRNPATFYGLDLATL